MHFHVPKPLHGWRAFLGEVGIIVLGVLIALAAEQFAESLHWRHEVQAARDALYSEAADNLDSVDTRTQQQSCIDRRLNELAAIFADHANGRPLNLRGSVGRPIFYGASQDAWQVEVAGQALAHMSIPEKLRFSKAFSAYASLKDILLREQDAWLRLGMLDHPEFLREPDWTVLHEAFAEATSLNGRLRIMLSYVERQRSLDQQPRRAPPPSGIREGLRTLCSAVRA